MKTEAGSSVILKPNKQVINEPLDLASIIQIPI